MFPLITNTFYMSIVVYDIQTITQTFTVLQKPQL